jgi:restriction system protein
MKSECGATQVSYTKTGLRRYHVEVKHQGLHKYQVVRGDNEHVVRQKARALMSQWDQMWAQRQAKERRVATVQEKKNLAAERTAEAVVALEALEHVLAHTLKVNDAIDWESLKDYSDYPEATPRVPAKPVPPKEADMLPAPQRSDRQYEVVPGFMDRLFGRQATLERRAQERFEADQNRWQQEWLSRQMKYADALAEWERAQEALEVWQKQRTDFLAARDASNAAVDAQKADYLRGDDPQAIVDYCDLVLSNSQYPDYFPQSYELDYNPVNQLLLVDYQLPAVPDLPTLREITYVQSRDEFREKHITQAQLNRLYDDLLYQIALRTIHELYEADQIGALATVVFNGYVNAIDPATGRETNNCVLSVQAAREEFERINLAHIDPKACFKSLKGVGSSKLHSLTPVAPIVVMEREDSRFITGYGVADAIQEGDNLAAMDWADFEHLIRELFEKEFAAAGGEVKVTRASRDGGVDAVVFDPDPLRGGKIVIQAKRYTATVGVSAVRDLYGTLMNEGANKGILVTTSDYGPDAYDFAKGKPLVLLNGANLLHLLERHGHKARIDLKEARQMSAWNGE